MTKFDLRLFTQLPPAKSTDAGTDTAFVGGANNNLQAEIKTYYVKELLRNAEPQMVFNQFGQKKPIPKGAGKTIEWRKFSKLAPATLPIQEGVLPDGNKRSVKTITAQPLQYGDYIRHTDILETTAFDPIITEDCREQGVQAGKTIDILTRNVLCATTNIMYAGGAATVGAMKSTDYITVNDVFKAVNKLERMDIAPIEGGDYVAVIHPDAATQLMLDDKWVDVTKYTTSDKIFNGEIGKIANCRFVKTSHALHEQETLADGAGIVYDTLFLGANAYGVTELEGLGLEYIIKPRGYNDELDLISSTGWKATTGAVILDPTAILNYRSCTFRSKDLTIGSNTYVDDYKHGDE